MSRADEGESFNTARPRKRRRRAVTPLRLRAGELLVTGEEKTGGAALVRAGGSPRGAARKLRETGNTAAELMGDYLSVRSPEITLPALGRRCLAEARRLLEDPDTSDSVRAGLVVAFSRLASECGVEESTSTMDGSVTLLAKVALAAYLGGRLAGERYVSQPERAQATRERAATKLRSLEADLVRCRAVERAASSGPGYRPAFTSREE